MRAVSPGGQARQRGGRLGDHHAVAVGDRVAVRVAAGLAELRGDAVLEPLGDVVLQAVGLRVHLVPRHAEVLDEVELQQAVVAQHLERDRLAARRQAHAVVRLVGHQPQAVEALDHAGDGGRRDAQPVGQRLRADRGAVVGLSAIWWMALR